MPHDQNGKVLSVGDVVTIQAKVKEIHNTEEYCNVTLHTTRDMFPTSQPSTIVLNAGQVVKV